MKTITKPDLGNNPKTPSISKKKRSSPIELKTTSPDELRIALRKKVPNDVKLLVGNPKPSPPNDGRFEKGVSGNPAGRPLGSRNKSTLFADQVIEGAAEDVARVLLELGLNGNIPALRMLVTRALPVRKERYIELSIRPTDNPNDLPVSYGDVMTAVAQGQITPGEGSALANIMSAHATSNHARELAQWLKERRIEWGKHSE